MTALAIRLSGSGEPVPAEPWHAKARALWPQQAAARQAEESSEGQTWVRETKW